MGEVTGTMIWDPILERLGAPEPNFTAEDEDGFSIAWSRGPHYLEIFGEVGMVVDWIYIEGPRSGSTFKVDLNEGIPDDLRARLALFNE